ncbi:MAG: hypothetical protein Q4B60_06045 [Erysipelotrichaceae bacterium]|nr:hypothetical protein [Erysipelotrichaceae bacterium]
MLKKILCICLALLLTACKPVGDVMTSSNAYSLLCSTGTPAISLLSIINSEHSIDISEDINVIGEAFDKADYDFVIAPINLGVNKSVSSGNYLLLSVVSYGTYNLVSTDSTLNKGNVLAMNKNGVIKDVLEYLKQTDLRKYDFEWCNSMYDIEYNFNNSGTVAAVVDEVSYNYLSSALGRELFKIEDINVDYEYQSHYDQIPEYGMFVRKEIAEKDQANLASFAKTLKTNIALYKTDKTTFNKVLNDSDISKIGFDSRELISESYNYCGLDFVYAVNDYDKISFVLSLSESTVPETIIVK